MISMKQGKVTMAGIAQVSIKASLLMTLILVGGRLINYGIERVTSEWYIGIGFFIFSFVVLFLTILLAERFGETGKFW